MTLNLGFTGMCSLGSLVQFVNNNLAQNGFLDSN